MHVCKRDKEETKINKEQFSKFLYFILETEKIHYPTKQAKANHSQNTVQTTSTKGFWCGCFGLQTCSNEPDQDGKWSLIQLEEKAFNPLVLEFYKTFELC